MRKRGPGVAGIKRNESMITALREKGAELQEDRGRHATEVKSVFALILMLIHILKIRWSQHLGRNLKISHGVVHPIYLSIFFFFHIQLLFVHSKYKSQIKSDPYFRSTFQMMCEKIGVDPLASGKGLWGELLGLGDFYYELGVRIIEQCLV